MKPLATDQLSQRATVAIADVEMKDVEVREGSKACVDVIFYMVRRSNDYPNIDRDKRKNTYETRVQTIVDLTFSSSYPRFAGDGESCSTTSHTEKR